LPVATKKMPIEHHNVFLPVGRSIVHVFGSTTTHDSYF
jgi:hypothetical protein